MGVPQFTQNLEVSATWAPQFVQKAMMLVAAPLSLCYENDMARVHE